MSTKNKIMSEKKTKSKITNNIAFEGNIETIRFIKSSDINYIAFCGQDEGDYYFSIELSEIDEFISALQLAKKTK